MTELKEELEALKRVLAEHASVKRELDQTREERDQALDELKGTDLFRLRRPVLCASCATVPGGPCLSHRSHPADATARRLARPQPARAGHGSLF